MIRAWGSPKIPVTVGLGRNPGKRYASHSRRGRRGVGMRRSCPIPASPPQRFRPLPERLSAPSAPSFHPLTSTKSLHSIAVGSVPNDELCHRYAGVAPLHELVRVVLDADRVLVERSRAHPRLSFFGGSELSI